MHPKERYIHIKFVIDWLRATLPVWAKFPFFDMIWKRLEEMQADLKGARTDLAGVHEKLGGIRTTLVGVQRDVRSLQGTVAILALPSMTRRTGLTGLNSASVSALPRTSAAHVPAAGRLAYLDLDRDLADFVALSDT